MQRLFGESVFQHDPDLLKRRCYPVQFGLVQSWDDLYILWNHIFTTKLECDMEKTSLLVVEGEARNPEINREKMTELAFERFNVPAFYLAPAPALIMMVDLLLNLSIPIIRLSIHIYH